LFVWQLPHFLAIALFRQEEYRAAGLKSVPIEDGVDVARLQLAILALLLWPVTVLPYAHGLAGRGYLAVAVLSGALFAGGAVWGWWRKAEGAWARRIFWGTLLHLTLLFVLLAVDVVR
jgi:protoheme IX farnesyltransferase